ncbi:MAG: hypothetical protein M3Z33_09985 [Actinomycetota bacterium]|nr:hypothetical protein [Actinomycetota bacterium]
MRQLRRVGAAVAAIIGSIAVSAASAQAAPVSSGHSGWAWGNPTPQGNTLRGLEFSGLRGYATGAFGTVLRTDDGGSSWSGIQTGIIAPLAGLRIVGSPDTIVLGGECSARRSDNGGASFNRLPFTSSDFGCGATKLTSLSFPSASVGYLLLGDGSVRRTADGGQTFANRVAVPGTQATGASSAASANDIFFTAPEVGFTVTGPASGAGGPGTVYRTTDGGGSWTLVATLSQGLNGVSFAGASTGYAVGNGNLVSKTGDGGASWSAPRPVPGGARKLVSVRCATADTCLVTNESGAGLLRTADGASSFAEVTPSDKPIYAAAFASPSRAVAVGQNGVTVVSDDGGVTWRAVGSRLTGTFYALRASSASTAYALGESGALARTTDGGGSWSPVGVPTSTRLVGVSFPTDSVGFALDGDGQLQRTDNSGASWQLLSTVRASDVLGIDARTVLLAGPRGVRRSTNRGQEFSSVGGRAVGRTTLGHVFSAGGAIFAWGSRAILRSTNGGRSWRSLRRPSRSAVVSLDFVDRSKGFAVDSRGRLFATGNAGRRWRQLVGFGSSVARQVDFATARAGFVRVNTFGGAFGGWVLRTSDGGRTWRPQLLEGERLVDVAATGSSTGLALAGDAGLFTTASGGDQGTSSRLTLSGRPSRLRRGGRVTISGRLRPSEGRETVRVSKLERGRWRGQVVQVASNGTFTSTWRIDRTAVFVAQWAGDDDRNGAGSVPLTIRTGR